MTQVFLSYADEDRAFMQKIAKTLMREGMTVWTNRTDIKSGAEYGELIDRGIEQADNMVFLMSPASLKSAYCQKELTYARSLNKRILVDNSNPVLTTQANPTFLFYLPYSQSPNRTQDGQGNKVATAEFELQDENENSVLKNQKIVFSLPEKPGFVKITLPNTETVLEPDKEYFWIFRIICDPNDNSANPSVTGWIKRVRSGSSENLWFDRLDQLTQSPMNRLEEWTQLLRLVDPKLQDLAQTPIVELKPQQ